MAFNDHQLIKADFTYSPGYILEDKDYKTVSFGYDSKKFINNFAAIYGHRQSKTVPVTGSELWDSKLELERQEDDGGSMSYHVRVVLDA